MANARVKPKKAARRLARRIAAFEALEKNGNPEIRSCIARGGMKRPGSLRK